MIKFLNAVCIMFIIFTISGCGMTMRENPDGSFTLSGFGSGEGEIEGKAKIKKGLVAIPNGLIRVNQ